jgi:hypothetical protein
MQESIETLRTELEERLRFETLLAETSARFVNPPVCLQMLGTPGSERLKVTALMLFHPITSLSSKAGILYCETLSEY